MTIADWLIVLAVTVSVAIGLFRGFVVEVMALVVWGVAIVASVLFAPRVTDALVGIIEATSGRIFLGYALVFVGTLLLGAVVTWLMRKLVQSTGLSGTDRLLGGVFGIVRGAVLVVIVVLMLGLTPFPRDDWWRDSRLLPHVVPLAERARTMLPARVGDQIQLDSTTTTAPAAVEPAAVRPGDDTISRT